MTFSRPVIRLCSSVVLAVAVVIVTLPTHAGATPICTSTPSGTTCVDPTGSCLIANYPNHGPATCLRNPIGSIALP